MFKQHAGRDCLTSNRVAAGEAIEKRLMVGHCKMQETVVILQAHMIMVDTSLESTQNTGRVIVGRIMGHGSWVNGDNVYNWL